MINYLDFYENHPENNIIVSGMCPFVKEAFAEKALKSALLQKRKVLLLDFQRKSDFSDFLNGNGFSDHFVYKFENNAYKSDMTVSNFRNHAKKILANNAKTAELTSLLVFLDSLENNNSSLNELLYKFRNQQQVESVLINQIKNRKISHQEAQYKLQRYLELIPNGIIADNILDDFEFVISYNKKSVFSISELDRHDAVVMYMDKNNSADSNTYLAEQVTNDIIRYISKNNCLIIVQSGIYNQTERLYEMIETLSKSDSYVLYFSDNIFSAVEKYRTFDFLNLFTYNIFGKTPFPYSKNVSELLGEREIEKITSVSEYDSRNYSFFSERIINRLFATDDYSESTTFALVNEPFVKPEELQNMGEKSYIWYDTNNCTSAWGYLR